MAFSIAQAWGNSIATKQQGRLAPFLAVCFAAGTLVYAAPATEPPSWLGAMAMSLAFPAFMILRHRWLARGAALMFLAITGGFLAGQIGTWRAPAWQALPPNAVDVTGIVRAVDILPDGRRVSIAAPHFDAGPKLHRFVRIRLQAKDKVALIAGDRIELRALLRSPPPPAVPGGQNLQRDAYFSGLDGSGWAISPARITPATHAAWLLWWRNVREKIGARFLADLPSPEGAIAATLFAGDQTAIPAADRTAFADSGLAHLLAVAGLHIAIVMGFGYGLVRTGLALSEYAALRWPCKQIAAVAGLGLGLFYMLLTGAHVPILRSFSMAALVVLAVVSGRRAASLRGLGLAAILVLAIWPSSILDVSFQMSFAAVLALIEGHRAARGWVARLPMRWLARPCDVALTSLLAGAASMPFAAAHFGHATAYFVPANLLAVPLAACWVMPVGLITLVLMPLHLAWLSMPLLKAGLHLMVLVAHMVASWPGAVFSWPPCPGWTLALVGLGLSWITIWRGWLRWVGAPVLVAGVVMPWLIGPPDLLIAQDGHLIALRRSHDMAAEEQPGMSNYVLGNWRRYWGRPSVTTLPPMGQGEAFHCATNACRLGQLGPVVLMRDQTPPVCAGVILVVGSMPCQHEPLVDLATLRQRGAVAVWFGERATLVFARGKHADRPWDRLPPPADPLPDLPMAPAE